MFSVHLEPSVPIVCPDLFTPPCFLASIPRLDSFASNCSLVCPARFFSFRIVPFDLVRLDFMFDFAAPISSFRCFCPASMFSFRSAHFEWFDQSRFDLVHFDPSYRLESSVSMVCLDLFDRCAATRLLRFDSFASNCSSRLPRFDGFSLRLFASSS